MRGVGLGRAGEPVGMEGGREGGREGGGGREGREKSLCCQSLGVISVLLPVTNYNYICW